MFPQFQQQNPYLFQISKSDIEDKITKVNVENKIVFPVPNSQRQNNQL